MKNQLIKSLSFAEYQAIEAVNFSSLKNIARSPAYYKWALNSDKSTSAMDIGRTAHVKILEPDTFYDRVVFFKGDKRKKEWKDFQYIHAGKDILTVAEMAAVNGIAEAVKTHPMTCNEFKTGEAELTVIWTDPNTGILCKARLDWVAADFITDLKTSADPSKYAFCRSAAKYRYFTQFSWYQYGYYCVTGDRIPVQCVAVGNRAPHELVVYEVTGDVLNHGSKEFTAMLERLKECMESNDYPPVNYNEKVALEVPQWCLPYGTEYDDSDPFAGM